MKIGFTITRHIEFEDNNIPDSIIEAIGEHIDIYEDEISDLDLLDYLNEVETDCRNVNITDDTVKYKLDFIEE